MIDLPAINSEVEILHPAFRLWVKKVKGYMSYPDVGDIKLWYEFQDYLEKFEVKDAL